MSLGAYAVYIDSILCKTVLWTTQTNYKPTSLGKRPARGRRSAPMAASSCLEGRAGVGAEAARSGVRLPSLSGDAPRFPSLEVGFDGGATREVFRLSRTGERSDCATTWRAVRIGAVMSSLPTRPRGMAEPLAPTVLCTAYPRW